MVQIHTINEQMDNLITQQELVIQLYKINNTPAITKVTGLSRFKILTILKNRGVRLHTKQEQLIISSGKADKLHLMTEEAMKRMYCDENMSVQDIAQLLGIHERNVYPWLKKFGIKTKHIDDSGKKIYYTYALCDPREAGGELAGYHLPFKPFYVGYGKYSRCYQHTKKNLKCNAAKIAKIRSIENAGHNVYIQKLGSGMDILQAIKEERFLISTGIDLTNISSGGEIGGMTAKKTAKYSIDISTGMAKLLTVYQSLREATDSVNGSKLALATLDKMKISYGFLWLTGEHFSDVIQYKMQPKPTKVPAPSRKKPIFVFDKTYKLVGTFASAVEAKTRRRNVMRRGETFLVPTKNEAQAKLLIDSYLAKEKLVMGAKSMRVSVDGVLYDSAAKAQVNNNIRGISYHAKNGKTDFYIKGKHVIIHTPKVPL